MIGAVIVMGLIRMIEVVLVLVGEGIFGLIQTSRVVWVTLEEVEAPSKRLVRETCSRYVLSSWKSSNNVSTFVLQCCRCSMSFYRQQAVGVKSSGIRRSELHVVGQKGVSVLEIHCSGLPKVGVMSLVNA